MAQQQDDYELNTASGTSESVIAQDTVAAVARITHIAWSRTASIVRTLWSHRIRFSYAFYTIVFTIITAAATVFLQWSVYSEPTYDDPNAVDDYTKAWNSIAGQITKFVAQVWLQKINNALLNFLILGLMYLVLVFLINRFWVATAVFSVVMTAFVVANHIKVELRNEPIIPSDLSFVSGGNSGEIWSFIPQDDLALVHGSIRMLFWLVLVCAGLQLLDRRCCVIPFYWRRPLRSRPIIIGNVTRLIAVIVSAATLFSFTWNLGIPGSWSYEWAKSMGDSPRLYNALEDSQVNGPAMNFLRLAHAKTMEKPESYSKTTMQTLAGRYKAISTTINQTRSNDIAASTVIMLLSETFSDPMRVPGITLTEDPMPNIRSLKNTTTSGLMLSPGYGGGTANIEYQSLTGLSLALFDDSMQSPYQELVPHQKHPYTFNQIWNDTYGDNASIAFHPYYKNMYLRDSNYKKFGFSSFSTLDSNPPISYQNHIDNSPYTSDSDTYHSVVDTIQQTDHPQFIQLVTMQNHMPYNDWYIDNQFKAADISQLNDGEKYAIDTYTKGISITDQATADFLNQLNQIDKPITVIFYGDHLPSIYPTAASDPDNTLSLHETDYFIWSNQASPSAGTKLDEQSNAYASSNMFMSMTAEHMNAKVSPYLSLLTKLHDVTPALSRLVLGAGGFGNDTSTTYLDANGNQITQQDLSDQAKQLLNDYRLVQYDMTAGKGYLNDTDFFAVP